MKKETYKLIATAGFLFALVFSGCKPKETNEEPIVAVPFTQVKVSDNFWAPKIKTNHEVTIPIAIEQSTISGRIKNFEIAGGMAEGNFCTEYPFDDSDIYKIIEAASYSMQTYPDPKMDAVLDSLIYKVGKAQEADGYIYTIRTIMGDNAHDWIGKRWEKEHILSHELYNLGHLFEGAVAHYQATGKRNFLDIAIKSANLIDSVFGWDKLKTFPGHQEVELGLVKMYHATGEKRYLDLAKFFLDVRGTLPEGDEYSQSHAKVVDQTKAVGHAVRATYMYSAMADVAALYQDESYHKTLKAIWEDIVYSKIYVTGGIGASGGNEGFAGDYNLPNMSAYCETCASVGMILWNYRMFLAEGDAKYYDVLEKTLYNAFLSGVSLKGDRFFYPNVLESMGQHQRGKWFGCACCPPNVARLLPSLPGYIFATSGNNLYINLFMENTANIDIAGNKIEIAQKTNYPWDGKVTVTLNPAKEQRFAVKIRIPGWAQNTALPGDLYRFKNQSMQAIEISLNGKNKAVTVDTKGYVTIMNTWEKNDKIEINFPMEIKSVLADNRIAADRNKMAIERGPIMFCAEGSDNNHGNVLSLMFDKESAFDGIFNDTLLNGVEVVKTKAREVGRNVDNTFKFSNPVEVTLIPYYAWNNRGAGEMMVWLPTDTSSVYPQPAPTIISKSKLTASRMAPSLKIALADQYQPENSNDHARPYFHWWPENNSWQWVQSDFEQAETVTKCRVYWYDDSPFGGCRIPDAWNIQYLENGKWKAVKALSDYKVSKDGWNEIEFEPITTKALKLNVKLSEKFSSGIHEWEIK